MSLINEYRTPPRLEIEIDGYLMTSAPDVGIQLFAKDTRVDLVVEVRLNDANSVHQTLTLQ